MGLTSPRRGPRYLGSWPLLLGLIAVGRPVAAQQPDAYVPYATLTTALRRLVDSHRDLAELKSIGTTRAGRDIWVVQIAGRSSVPPADRPAVFIAANLEGDQVVGSALALAVIDRLVTGYAADTAVKARLDSTTFYIVPRANPDAAEAMFAAVKTGRRTNATPYDDDNDGRIDEDGPEDLNGDGQITVMRVPDPHGRYLVDSADPRLMKRADPANGERGTHTLYWEGVDSDGDSVLNEDPPGGVDLNRNFQHRYPYYARDAGRHMVSEPESRAVMDFLLAHRNVAAILTFGASDNLIVTDTAFERHVDLYRFADEAAGEERGGAAGSAPGSPDPSDLPYFMAVSKMYREITGLTEPPAVRPPRGALFGYGYHQFGVPSFSTPGWGLSAAPATTTATATAPVSGAIDRRLLQWLDAEKIDGFVPWAPFKHPTLGSVEIGGFKPYSISNPPATALATLGPAHAKFALYLASLLPRAVLASVRVRPQGGDLFRVTAEVENTGFFPMTSARGVRPTMVQLGVDPKAVIAGAAKTSFIPALEGSGRRTTLEWLIRGKSGDRITLVLRSEKGGTASRSFVLP